MPTYILNPQHRKALLWVTINGRPYSGAPDMNTAKTIKVAAQRQWPGELVAIEQTPGTWEVADQMPNKAKFCTPKTTETT